LSYGTEKQLKTVMSTQLCQGSLIVFEEVISTLKYTTVIRIVVVSLKSEEI